MVPTISSVRKLPMAAGGANIIQDSAYLIAAADDSGAPLASRNRYRLHIPADGYPHASVFWSITLYGRAQQVSGVQSHWAVQGQYL